MNDHNGLWKQFLTVELYQFCLQKLLNPAFWAVAMWFKATIYYDVLQSAASSMPTEFTASRFLFAVKFFYSISDESMC